jgi:hypothetical protein
MEMVILRLWIVDRKFGISSFQWNSFKNREQIKISMASLNHGTSKRRLALALGSLLLPLGVKYHTFHQRHLPTSPILSRYCHRRTNDTLSDRSLIDDLPRDMLTRRSGHSRRSKHLTIYASTVFLHTLISCVDGSSCFDRRCRSAS